VTLWEINVEPVDGQPDLVGQAVRSEAADLGLATGIEVRFVRGYLVQGPFDKTQIAAFTRELLADSVIEKATYDRVGAPALTTSPGPGWTIVNVLAKSGVMDPVADSAMAAIAAMGKPAEAFRTLRKYWVKGIAGDALKTLSTKLLANESVDQIIVGPLHLSHIDIGGPWKFEKKSISITKASDEELLRVSREGTLSLTLVEMQTIAAHFRGLGREPTDIELETIAQTWSEHCSHKTLGGKIDYRDEKGTRKFNKMLKETIFAATEEIRRSLGDRDWCVSVFKDNAGIVRFDDEFNVCFKVETHNRPSAIEPYGGANTGIGGVIRDTLGTGLGAKPICNTDVFCFAPPDTPVEKLPPGVLHPRRIMKGVVAGVRDYGNRMGIPTVNGAIHFHERYVGNPLVFCGNVGLLPRDKSFKKALPGDYIVAVGGRTGRDGIHGATFSSVELTSESEVVSSGAVQIGNAITEKMVVDVVLQARDLGLFNAVTDCGAGGFSSAVGEMGEEIGAEVWLDKAPLKYAGLSYTEIWISEAQERMVLAVPAEKWDAFHSLCDSEGVEATILGAFAPTKMLTLKFEDQIVGEVSMEFLHNGRPPVVRDATYTPKSTTLLPLPKSLENKATQTLLKILSAPSVASKEWVIRQYDHEVQGASVIKPLVGVMNDGPSDAAVLRPVLSSKRGLVISNGMNPRYGDFDPYDMAASAIDEAMRNCVAVGADPAQIAILDNFCWGYTDRPETLGSLVRAALACYDSAVALQTPFISGKDSLNNEYSYVDAQGVRQTISIPATLLISAMGQISDVTRCVSMDLKEAGNWIYLVGRTKNEFGGSHFAAIEGLSGGAVPKVDLQLAKATFTAIHRAISSQLIRSCHDLSEGGLAVAAAEMAFAGGFGIDLTLADSTYLETPVSGESIDLIALFSESNTRFLCEVTPENASAFEAALAGVPLTKLGVVTAKPVLRISGAAGKELISSSIADLKNAWKSPLNW
jgi:phosphoribosylformylglycinamidine synthase II